MNILDIGTALLIAIGFTSWGIAGRYSQANGGWVGFIAMGITTLVIGILSFKQLRIEALTGKMFMIIAIAGALNGAAVCAYSFKVTNVAIPAATFMVTVSIFMAVVTPCLDWTINGTAPNLRQVIGYVLAVGAIYFLSK